MRLTLVMLLASCCCASPPPSERAQRLSQEATRYMTAPRVGQRR